MISRLCTPRSSQRFFISARYFSSFALLLKNWLTYSTASMPNSCFATPGKSRWSIFPPNSALLNDHWAREILNISFPAEAPGAAAFGAGPAPNPCDDNADAAARAPQARTNVRRVDKVIRFLSRAALLVNDGWV